MGKPKDKPMAMLPRIILALVLSCPFIFFGSIMLEGGHIGAIFGTLFICAGIIIISIFMSFPAARRIAEPWGGIFFPAERFKQTKPMYSIPESRIANGMYEEAMAEYEKIILEYPSEMKPYLDMMTVAMDYLRDPDWANTIYQRGMQTLEDKRIKEQLTQAYHALLE